MVYTLTRERKAGMQDVLIWSFFEEENCMKGEEATTDHQSNPVSIRKEGMKEGRKEDKKRGREEEREGRIE